MHLHSQSSNISIKELADNTSDGLVLSGTLGILYISPLNREINTLCFPSWSVYFTCTVNIVTCQASSVTSKMRIQIGSWIYSLRLQPRQITITWKNFFDSIHQQFTGSSLESLWDQLNQFFLAQPKWLDWLGSRTPTKWLELKLPSNCPFTQTELNWTELDSEDWLKVSSRGPQRITDHPRWSVTAVTVTAGTWVCNQLCIHHCRKPLLQKRPFPSS
jgi:hypothetical protein